MGKKYLDTKEGSLEQSILGLWEKAAVKQEKLVGGQKKLDKDKDGDIDGKDFAMLRKSKKKDKKEEVEEALEWGTDELRKHTEDVTPGQNGDWVEAVNGKNDSMREALAKVWNTTEDKNPFKKEDKKDLTKEVKNGKTMTGKKVASVEVNPTIKEKTK